MTAIATAISAQAGATKKSPAPMVQSVKSLTRHQIKGSIRSGHRPRPSARANNASVASAVGSGASPNISAESGCRPVNEATNGYPPRPAQMECPLRATALAAIFLSNLLTLLRPSSGTACHSFAGQPLGAKLRSEQASCSFFGLVFGDRLHAVLFPLQQPFGAPARHCVFACVLQATIVRRY